jgi:hypothetical protein
MFYESKIQINSLVTRNYLLVTTYYLHAIKSMDLY